MVTFLSGGTGTPKLLDGATTVFAPEEITVIANTGDDIELGDLFICPDVDTVLYWGGDMLDRETWWGIADDTTTTHDRLTALREAVGLDATPQFLPAEQQTAGRELATWRRFAALPEFMLLGDYDRAVHRLRTHLLDMGQSLTTVTNQLAAAFDLSIDVYPMSNDPVASLIHTPTGLMHFQEFWVARHGEPTVNDVEFRGAQTAAPAPGVRDALADTVVIGPSNPVTSIGPMLAIDGIAEALAETTVIVVSPFIGDEVFSGPAAQLMDAVDIPPATAGLPEAYPFADAYVLDTTDETTIDAPTVRTDITIETTTDATRVARAVNTAAERV